MRTSQIAALCLIAVLTASAGLALRLRHGGTENATRAQALQVTDASDWALMQTPSNEGIPPVPNKITISNLEKTVQQDRPTTIPRFFAPGEVPAGKCASAVVDGAPVPTQCDAKTHWPDGSLQHALLTFKATFASNSVEVAFVPSEQPLAGDGLDVNSMISADFDFSAILEVETKDGYQWANAREMLKAGMFRYWLKGPLVTQIIIEEQGASPGQDFMDNGFRSVHPIFIVTFYPGHRGVRIETISEIAWFTRLRTVTYSAKFWTGGYGAEQVAYELKNYTQLPRTRWRYDSWSGPALGKINVNHNLPYMVYSRILPNFDLSRTLMSSGIDHELNEFKAADNHPKLGPQNCSKPGGTCEWQPAFGNTGGRPDLGILPRWDVRYLYSFDPRLFNVVIANANASGHVPIHVRESANGRVFHLAAQTPGDANGRVVSVDTRPCYVSRDDDKSCGEDRPVPPDVGVPNKHLWGVWGPDIAHQGSFTFVAYLVTGDYYYLEELYFWSGWNLAWADSANVLWGRGGTKGNPGIFGVINCAENYRAIGWGLRTLAQTAILAPDGSPEKGYFVEKMLNNIVAQEGRFSVKDGLLAQSPERQEVWDHGFRDLAVSVPNPKGWWWPSFVWGASPPYYLNPATCGSWVSTPMQNYINTAIGYATELGFPSAALKQFALRNNLNQLANPDFNRYTVDEIDMCTGQKHLVYFTSWKDVLNGYKPEVRDRNTFAGMPQGETELGFGYVALAAASYLGDVNEGNMIGRDAHKWLADNYPKQDSLNWNPKWALVPRGYAFKGSISSPETWSSKLKAASKPAIKGRVESARVR